MTDPEKHPAGRAVEVKACGPCPFTDYSGSGIAHCCLTRASVSEHVDVDRPAWCPLEAGSGVLVRPAQPPPITLPLRDSVAIWLGFHRDSIPAAAVARLQQVLAQAPVPRSKTKNYWLCSACRTVHDWHDDDEPGRCPQCGGVKYTQLKEATTT